MVLPVLVIVIIMSGSTCFGWMQITGSTDSETAPLGTCQCTSAGESVELYEVTMGRLIIKK